MNWSVYCHTTPDNKMYIGITGQKPRKRWQNGYGYINNKYFYNAIQKFGWNRIKHEILYDGLSKEDACKKEIELISKYKTTDRTNGYNIETGGTTPIMSEETKRKISVSHMGINNPMYGKPMTENAKRKRNETMKMIGYNHSEETKKKISKAHKGLPIHDNTRKAVTVSNKKRIENGEKIWESLCIAVDQYSLNGIFIATYPSIAEAGRVVNIDSGNIGKCIKGIYKQSGGYVWRKHMI